jgi:hypothetical protein
MPFGYNNKSPQVGGIRRKTATGRGIRIPAQATGPIACSPTGLAGPDDVANIAHGTALMPGPEDNTGVNDVRGTQSWF